MKSLPVPQVISDTPFPVTRAVCRDYCPDLACTHVSVCVWGVYFHKDIKICIFFTSSCPHVKLFLKDARAPVYVNPALVPVTSIFPLFPVTQIGVCEVERSFSSIGTNQWDTPEVRPPKSAWMFPAGSSLPLKVTQRSYLTQRVCEGIVEPPPASADSPLDVSVIHNQTKKRKPERRDCDVNRKNTGDRVESINL